MENTGFVKPERLEEKAAAEQRKVSAEQKRLNDHGDKLTELLQNYVENYKTRNNHNNDFRNEYFRGTIMILVTLTVGVLLAMFLLLWCEKISDVAAVAGLISSIAAILSGVIILPKIIAEYLFSTNEDTINAEIIKEIIKSDLEIRNHLEMKEEQFSDN